MSFNRNQRIPKNYQGRKPTGRQIKDLLGSLLNEIQEQVKAQPGDVIEAWPKLVGEKIASMTEALSFQSGVLVVRVHNSALYSLLVTHEKKRLESLLQSSFPTLTISKIQFRIR